MKAVREDIRHFIRQVRVILGGKIQKYCFSRNSMVQFLYLRLETKKINNKKFVSIFNECIKIWGEICIFFVKVPDFEEGINFQSLPCVTCICFKKCTIMRCHVL